LAIPELSGIKPKHHASQPILKPVRQIGLLHLEPNDADLVSHLRLSSEIITPLQWLTFALPFSAASLNEDSTKAEAADILRSLIEKIILRPDHDAANGHTIELYRELAAILSLCGNGMGTNAKTHASCVGIGQVTMVAGARYQKYLPLYSGCFG
jgi:hypothetical protein